MIPRSHPVLRSLSYTLAILTAPSLAATQPAPPPPDTVRAIARLHAIVTAHGASFGPRIWPGFRPDTIHMLYVVPGRAKLLLPWVDGLANGFTPLGDAPSMAWAGTGPVSWPPARLIASLSIDTTMTIGDALGTAIHEMFHSYERASQRDDRSFGQWENTVLVSRYPVFDAESEAAWALEGRLLRAARDAPTADAARPLAREFLAVRAYRRARLDSALVAFERFAEMNEGLAQYALVRGLEEVAAIAGGPWRAEAERARRIEARVLDSMLATGRRSVRRRYYATGSTIALLLDRLAPDRWKNELMTTRRVLEDVLVDATGGSPGGAPLPADLASRLRALAPEAERSVATLAARRAAQRDSLLARVGLRVTIDPSRVPGGKLFPCSFDPQNMLPTADGAMMHTRMLRACNGDVAADFEQAVVEQGDGRFVGVIADPTAVRMTSGGRPIALPDVGRAALDVTDLRLEAPGLTVTAPRAAIARGSDGVRITPAPR